MLTLGISLAGAVPATAQAPAVPLGQAARFGLLSGQTLTADPSSKVSVLGAVGAVAISGPVAADSGTFTSGTGLLPMALTDLTDARAACSASTAQPLTGFGSQSLTPGVYSFAGSGATIPTGGAVWTLSGSSSDRYIFNVSGNWTIANELIVALNGVAPANVYWNVGGTLVSSKSATLPGVVMAATINLSGFWGGHSALLSGGNLTLTSLDAMAGRTTWLNYRELCLVGRPQAGPQATTPCTNLIRNPSFEQRAPGITFPRGRGNLPNSNASCTLTGGDIIDWGNASLGTPDWFRRGSTTVNGVLLGIPTNDFGTADTRQQTGNSYVGVYSQNGRAISPPQTGFREYIFQQLATPLQANRLYYIEFFSNLASNSEFSMRTLGARLSAVCPYQNTATVFRDANNNLLTPHITSHDPSFNSLAVPGAQPPVAAVWSRTAGAYRAQGNEQFLTIGNFDNDAAATFQDISAGNGSNSRGAYYYLDDVGIYAFPQPSFSITAITCAGAVTTLDFTCLLPASSQAAYRWEDGAGQVVGTGTAALTITVPRTTTYTLVTTVTDPNGTTVTDRQSVTVPVTPLAVTISGPTSSSNQLALTYVATGTPIPGTYTWAGGPSGTTFSGNTLTVPAGASPGTYTISCTYTSQQFPTCPRTSTLQVTIRSYDCEETRGVDLRIPGDLPLTINANGSTYVFSAKRYRVDGAMLLTNGKFQAEPGAVFMFDGEGCSLTVGTGAEFVAQQTRFTAACDVMWQGIIVTADSKGFCLGRPGDTFTSPLPPPADYGQQLPVSEISHAHVALRWQHPVAAPVRLLHTRLLHNLVGVSCDGGATTTPVPATSALLNNQLDSAPLSFKQGSRGVDNYTHVGFELGGWNWQNVTLSGNRLRHSLVGVAVSAGSSSRLTLTNKNEFVNTWLAGVYAQGVGSGLTVSGNRFTLAYPSARPTAALLDRFEAAWPNFVSGFRDQTTGLYVVGGTSAAPARLVVQANEFVQPVPGLSFGTSAYAQRGVVVANLHYAYLFQDNQFRNLDVGLLVGLRYAGNATSKVASNFFQDCGTGIELFAPKMATYPAPPVLWPQCNTFRRTSTVALPSVGIRVVDGLPVVFDSWEMRQSTPQYLNGRPWMIFMKNRFDDRTGTAQRLRYLDNGNAAAIRYTAFTTSIAPYPINLVGELANAGRQTNFTVNSPSNPLTTEYTDARSCSVEDGLDDGFNLPRPGRAADSTATTPPRGSLGYASPNPVHAEATLSFELPTDAHHAELVIRAVRDGRVVLRRPVSVSAHQITISVAELPDGVYTYSIVADRAVLGTRRLLVNHATR